MIGELNPYPKYRDSGVSWIGKVPEHWDIKSFGSLGRLLNERDHPELPLLSVAREKGVFIRKLDDIGKNHNVIPDDLTNYKVARRGDLVINKMKAWQGSMGIAPCDGIVSPAYYVMSLKIADLTYGQFLLRSHPYVALFGRASDGVRIGQWDLGIAPMRRIPVLNPPPPEQSAIAKYLAHETSRIDKAIAAKKKVIALLEEEKRAIIQKAVTKGLDPKVKMKDSKIPGVGMIPDHWETPLSCFVFQERNRKFLGDVELLSLSQKDGLVKTAAMKERSLKAATHENWKLVLPNDLVLNRFKAHLGVFFASSLRGIVSFHYGVFTPNRSVNTKYYEYLYHTMPYRRIFAGKSNGMTVGLQNLSNQNFYGIRSLIPPYEEQIRIVDKITDMIAGQSAGIARVEKNISLLREYRTRLVADVVTGKLDVRKAAAGLPELDEADLASSRDDAGLESEEEEDLEEDAEA